MAGALVAAGTAPAPDLVSPGIAGFVVVFMLALATVLLLRSMVGHLRKVRYGPGPDAAASPPAEGRSDPGEAPDQPSGPARRPEERSGTPDSRDEVT